MRPASWYCATSAALYGPLMSAAAVGCVGRLPSAGKLPCVLGAVAASNAGSSRGRSDCVSPHTAWISRSNNRKRPKP